MSLDNIKEMISSYIDKEVTFKYNGSRNQIEEFNGIITNAYKSIFIIRIENTDMVRSFAYTDVLIGNLELKL